MAVLDQADELFGPKCLEVALDHAKAQLNRVVLWAIAHVEDPPEAVVPHGLLGSL